MRGEPPHCVKGNGSPNDMSVGLTPAISPWDGELEGLLKCGKPQLLCQQPDALSRDSSNRLCPLGRGVLDLLL